LSASAFAVLLNSGCHLPEWVHNGFKVGPNYCRPRAPAASEWIDYRDPRVKSEEKPLSEWWRVFNDPALDALIEMAYQQNISLREAGARILAARAEQGIAVGELFPQSQNAFGEYKHIGISRNIANPFKKRWFNNVDVGFTAAWELDFWGRFRRAIEAADAELDATVENYDDVLVILLADVASNYTQLRTFQERLRFAWLNVVSQYNAYKLTADKYILGAATERDVQQAGQILEQTRALIPQLETGIRTANNQLCILLGIPSRELTELQVGTYEQELLPLKNVIQERTRVVASAVEQFTQTKQRPARELPGLLDREKDPKIAKLFLPLQRGTWIPATPVEVVVGIPADLLRRRPDVRRAERQAAAQSARIGIAESDFYPHFSVSGTIGVASENLGNLFSPGSFIGSIGPEFRWDILHYGRILNNVRVQDARFQELVLAYQNTVLQANTEAENSIVAFLNAQEETDRLAASVAAAARTVQISFDQYRLGAIDFTPVVLFESTLAQQQDQLAVSRGSITLNLIATYRALGGGWEMRLSRDGGTRCGQGTTPPAGEAVTVAPESVPVRSVPIWRRAKPPAGTDVMKVSPVSAQEKPGAPTAETDAQVIRLEN
jgi:outer membrane protein TolC